MANKRLIDANALRKRMFNYYSCVDENSRKEYYRGVTLMSYEVADLIEDCIDDAPTVDAEPVVHGHWKEYSHSALVRWKDGEPVWADRSVFRCSRCDFGTIAKHNYCPRCGAKMDGGNDDV